MDPTNLRCAGREYAGIGQIIRAALCGEIRGSNSIWGPLPHGELIARVTVAPDGEAEFFDLEPTTEEPETGPWESSRTWSGS